METSFKARKINNPSQSHILFACSFLRGKALTWFDAKPRKAEKEYRDAFGSWAEFVAEIRREFECYTARNQGTEKGESKKTSLIEWCYYLTKQYLFLEKNEQNNNTVICLNADHAFL